MARTRKRKPAESGETVARKIWLAGLGAYGKSVEDAHGQIDKASQEASKFFHDLVSKGQSIEDHSREALKERISEAKDRISEARERISEAAGSNTRTVEEMIGRVRERMGVDDAVHTRLDALARQVNALAQKVSGLSLRKGRAEPKTRDKPAGARKVATRAAAKPASRKPATRKPATTPARRGRPPKRLR
ncbi:MAG: phasin family protein [Pseudomonadales bacterium]|jgi:poly(hydroxyalkanoate) granule-associated protein|nr:phasin family protein [Pseudomonadales bacterium]MBP9032248.1 phasin family protein [Pseudomonadales bacterium]